MKRAIVIILLLAGVGALAWWLVRREQAAPPAKPAVTAKVHRGDIELLVDATGSVESNQDVEIKSKASGEVIKLPHDVSDRVPKYVPGKNEDEALLVRLDPIDESRRVQRAKAEADAATARLNQAQANLAIARADLAAARPRAEADIAAADAKSKLADLTRDRTLELRRRLVATQDEADNVVAQAKIAEAQLKVAEVQRQALASLELGVTLRQADVELAKANLDAAKVDLADAEQRLAETKIYSPIDGVLTQRKVEIGQIIASGIINIAGGTALMTVSDTSRMFVVAVVDESDIGRLVETGRLGQAVTVTADAYPGRRFTGQVVQITPWGTSEAKVVSFSVKIEITGGGIELLLPKMTADVSILANRKAGVLLAPNAAVMYDLDQPYVRVRQGGQFLRRNVKLGLNDGRQAEVIEGLSEGDEVTLITELRTKWSNEGKPVEPTSRAAAKATTRPEDGGK
jgi:HlyD family secretion protein